MKLHSAEDILLQMNGSLAVVGNAKFNKEYGEDIDKHDNIIRFNNFELNNYQKFVGFKTTIWCTNGSKSITNKGNIDKIISSFTSDCFESSKPNKNIILIHSSKRYDAGLKRPTTGFCLLNMLNTLKIKTDIYGFDFMKTGHYWQEHKHSSNNGKLIHDGNCESIFVKKLNYITIYT